MNDAGIIDLYWQRSERAIPETENAYGPYCHTVAYNLLRNAEDAEESVNDTWLAAWNAMPPERPNRASTRRTRPRSPSWASTACAST